MAGEHVGAPAIAHCETDQKGGDVVRPRSGMPQQCSATAKVLSKLTGIVGRYAIPANGQEKRTMAQPQHDNQANDDPTIIEAATDPLLSRIEHERKVDDEEAGFAAQEAAFAAAAEQRAKHLHEEHRDEEAEEIHREASWLMGDAIHTMQEVNDHEKEVMALEAQRKDQLAVVLREMPRQGLQTLRDAVSRVTEFVENLTPEDKLAIGLNAHMDATHIEDVRAEIIVRGQTLDQLLATEARVRHSPAAVIEELIAFTAAVMTIADHFEPLLRLAHEFGHLLLQFHM